MRPQIATHMLCGIPNGGAVECFPEPDRDPLWDRIVVSRRRPHDGIIGPPDGPGFGMRLDWDMVGCYRTN